MTEPMSGADSPKNNSLRILFLTTNFPNYPGHGSGPIVFQQAKGLSDRGHRITVLCPAGPGLKIEEDMDGVRVFRFRYAPDKNQRIAYGGGIPANLAAYPAQRLLVPSFMAAFCLHAHRLAKDADIVHAHWTPAGVAGSVASGGRPLILSFHGSDIMSEGKMIRALAHLASRRAAAFIVPGENMGRYALALGIPENRLHIVHHGLDASSVNPSAESSPRTILYLGRLSREKGPDVLLKAFSLLPRKQYRLSLVGAGPMEAALRNEATRLGFADEIEFTGGIPHKQALERVSHAAVFVIPSRREGFSVACLEAMAAAKPIVSTRCGGPEDLLTQEKSGLFVPVDDAEALAAATRRLLEDPALAERLGNAARETILERFTLNRMIDKLEAVYRGILKNS